MVNSKAGLSVLYGAILSIALLLGAVDSACAVPTRYTFSISDNATTHWAASFALTNQPRFALHAGAGSTLAFTLDPATDRLLSDITLNIQGATQRFNPTTGALIGTAVNRMNLNAVYEMELGALNTAGIMYTGAAGAVDGAEGNAELLSIGAGAFGVPVGTPGTTDGFDARAMANGNGLFMAIRGFDFRTTAQIGLIASLSGWLRFEAGLGSGDLNARLQLTSLTPINPTAVPEPASLVLLAAGLLGAGARRRRA